MKKFVGTAVLAAFIFCAFTSLRAQDAKKISEQEMNALRNTATEKLKSKNYRVKMTAESYRNVNDSAPYYFTKEITEYAAPGSYHKIWERKTSDGTTRTETISIGAKRYERTNNGEWKEITREAGGTRGGYGSTGKPIDNEKTVEYIYQGKKVINNQTADLYEIKTVTKYKQNDWQYTSVYIERFWFNQDSLFLKTETESGEGKKVTSHLSANTNTIRKSKSKRR